jgi:hypothetical protein
VKSDALRPEGGSARAGKGTGGHRRVLMTRVSRDAWPSPPQTTSALSAAQT